MRRILLLVLVLGLVIALTTVAFAYPSEVTVTCDFYGDFTTGYDCTDSFDDNHGLPGLTVLHGVSEFFEVGTYEISVKNGAWSATDTEHAGYLNGERLWFWGLTIMQSVSGTDTYYNLGDYNASYTNGTDALNNALSGNSTVTINMLEAGNLFFYVDDTTTPREDIGSVTVSVALVPEPISSALFIIGGVVLGGRSYMKRKKATSRA